MKRTLLFALLLFQFSVVHAQLNMQLLDQIDYSENTNDVWGWVDPDDGTEYALVGLRNGVSIVDLSDPQNVQEVQFVPGPISTWRDIKSWGHFVYVTNENSGGVRVIDMTGAPNSITWSNWTPFISGLGTLSDCHNLYIDEFGYCYLAGCNLNSGGILIADVFSNPGSPIYVGKGPNKYAHDVFAKGNKMYTSEIYLGELGIYNVANKLSINQLASQETPYDFTHNAWVNDAETVVFTTDEKANAPVAAYDISDLDDIVELDQFRPIETIGQNVIPHNVHVWNDWLIISYYTDGGIIADASRPENIIEVGNWDTFLGGNGGFSGVWGAYPFLPSGLVLLTDIGNGLYVCGADYVRACWLEGTITDAITSSPIFGADIHIESNLANQATSDLIGQYKTGQATAGTFDVVVSAPGYITQTISVTLQNGVLTILDVQLQPIIPVSSYSGTVISAVDGSPISGAIVILQSGTNFFTTATGANGIFTFNNIFVDSYTIAAARWGYQHASVENFAINLNPDPIILEMYEGYQDDFFASQGWTTDNTASSGWWNRVDPIGTFLNNQYANPEFDVTDDISDFCFVTGNGGGSSGNDDVDDGYVKLISPNMDLSGYYDPILSYRTWFVNGGGNTTANDTLKVLVSNGIEEVVVEEIHNSIPNWNDKSEIRLTDYIELTSTMKVTFEASDQPGSGHVVEAGVDAFKITETAYPPFTVSDTTGCPGDQLSFTDEGSLAFTWNWTFENGTPNSSGLQHPLVTFNDPGQYGVQLEVMTVTGQNFTVNLSDFITINTPPTASYSVDIDTLSASFSNNSTGGATFNWEFGDGMTSTEENPTHSYPAPGLYEVTLTVDGTCGPTTLTEELNIAAFQPTALFSFGETVGCNPLEVSFNDQSFGFPETWEWSFQGGDPATSNEPNPTVTYNTAGVFDVMLKVTNQAGESEYVLADLVEISTTPGIDISYSNDGAMVSFDNLTTNANSNLWEFNDGSGATSTELMPVHTFPGVGVYEVSFSATNDCGTVVSILEVAIGAIHPTAAFSVSGNAGCTPFTVQYNDESAGVPVSWEWEFPGGNPATSSEQNPLITYSVPGTYSAQLKVTNSAGESEISQTDIVIVDTTPTPDFTVDLIGPSAIFNNLSDNAIDYEWDFGDLSSNSMVQNPMHLFPGLGTYPVTLYATNQCGTEMLTQMVTVSVVQPTADFNATVTSGCAPLTVQFNDLSLGGEIDTWEWEFPGGNPASSTEQNPTVVFNNAGTYSATLKVTNIIGESEIELLNFIVVDDVPTPDFTFIVNGPEVIFTNESDNGISYEWHFGDGTGNTSTDTNTSYTFSDLGNYTITLTAFNSCGSAEIVDTITISAIQPTAAIVADATDGCAPFTVQFSDASTGGEMESWEWSFPGGNPSTSTEQNPQVEYNTIGTYEVSLIVTNPVGSSDETIQDYIIVDDVPSAGFDFQVNGPEVTFSNTTINGVSYSWEFGDNQGNTSNQENPAFAFDAIGDYEVTLTATNNCGSNVYSQIVTITTITSTFELDQHFIEIKTFPNPINEKVIVEYSMEEIYGEAKVKLLDAMGQTIAVKDIINKKGQINFHTENMPAGIYFLHFTVNDRIIGTKKLVKF